MRKLWLPPILFALALFTCTYIWYFHYEFILSVKFKNISIWQELSGSFFIGTTKDASYRTVKLNKSSIDNLIDQKKNQAQDEILESYKLSKDLRLLCWVMTNPKNHILKAQKVKETWGKRCNILLFMSSVAGTKWQILKLIDNTSSNRIITFNIFLYYSDPALPSIRLDLDHDGRDRLWAKTKQAFQYAYKHYR